MFFNIRNHIENIHQYTNNLEHVDSLKDVQGRLPRIQEVKPSERL